MGGADVVYGGNFNYNLELGTATATIPTGTEALSVGHCASIFEPATIWKREVWERVGPFDESLHYVFGWDFLARASKEFRFAALKEPASINRIHKTRKSNDGSEKRRIEILNHVNQFGDGQWNMIYEETMRLNRLKRMNVFNNIHRRFKKILFPLFFGTKISSYEEFSISQDTLYPEKNSE
ncbi:MAG: hypothetical protein D3910_28445 [Candidatus Electrothrix sp. ATG2]|nr:hypothetical protein [Candidatus Electrothrix sp. ATG2]